MTALPGDLTIRAATLADLDGLVALTTATDVTYAEFAPADWRPPPPDEERALWEGRIREHGGWCEVAEEADGRVIGAVAFRPGRGSSPGSSGQLVPGLAHVSAVFVHPDRWREGIAGALLARAEQAMRERGYERAQLFTPTEAPARRFYEAEGWHTDGRSDYAEMFSLSVVAYVKTVNRT